MSTFNWNTMTKSANCFGSFLWASNWRFPFVSGVITDWCTLWWNIVHSARLYQYGWWVFFGKAYLINLYKCTLPKFQWYNKASLVELVQLEILGKHRRGLLRESGRSPLALLAWYFLWSAQRFDQMVRYQGSLCCIVKNLWECTCA